MDKMKVALLLYSLLVLGILLTKLNYIFYPFVAIILLSPLLFYSIDELGLLKNIKKGILYGLLISVVYFPFIYDKIEITILSQVPQVFAEEIFFRGYLQTIFEDKFPSHKAIFIVSLMFCIPHIILFPSIVSALTFLPSLIFGYLFYITRSIYTSSIFHFFSNIFYIYIGQKIL
ncbi:MAG TPA: CPBP family intramembrane metalloprotease [Persephonella sp.]|nr:CPBP family intramembrane metalloprotease [Hydrogenothermaceae bacterium]HIQ24503.1 CPBP family intramembrane metalloprotease [Persephonella sp.]